MNTQKITKEYRLSQWTATIRQCRMSGMTVSAWCRENDVSVKSYYYWLRKVREAACAAMPEKPDSSSVSIVPLLRPLPSKDQQNQTVSSSQFSADAVLHIGTFALEIKTGISLEFLAGLLDVMYHVK